MTFGEFLSNIIKNKNISVTRLAELTDMKSRNSIQRILKDESSIKLIEAFKTKLIESDPLSLSVSELEQMKQSIEVTKVGKDTFEARRILLQVFNGGNHRTEYESPAAFNPIDQKSSSLKELFASYKTFSRISLLIFGSVSVDFTNDLIKLIQTSPPALIYITQILYFGNNRSNNATTFTSVLRLFNYEHYNVYNIVNDSAVDSFPNFLTNCIVIDKTTSEGDHYTDLIKMDNNRCFSYIMDVQGNSLYSFYLYHFNNIKVNCQNLRRTYKNENPIDTIISLSEICVPLEMNSARYLVKHSFSSSMIPTKTFVSLLVDNHYFGMDKDDPKVKELIHVFYERFNAFYHTEKMKVNLLTKRGLLDFVKTGLMTDQLCYCSPFTRDEVKAILDFILKQLVDNDYFKILLLKDDYSIGNLEFSYYENEVLWIFDSSSGYGEDYYDGIIVSAPILEVYDDFIKNELIRNHTLLESETIDFFKYLISIA